LIGNAAKKTSLQPEILHAVMKQESGFKPCAVSVRGAQGLMQLMPATAEQFHVADPFDPEQNVQAGAAFLKQLLGKYSGDLRLALIAYNAGAARADQGTDQSIPAETQSYLAHIFADLGIQRVEASATAEPVDPIKPVQDPKPILTNPARSQ
jgi:soluble lytic murein transglycosylase-like protein